MDWTLPSATAQRWCQNWFREWVVDRTRGRRLTQAQVGVLSHQLKDEHKALQAFAASTEDEFLALSAHLRRIASLAWQIGEQTTQITRLTSGAAVDAALPFAFQLLKKAEDLIEAVREQYSLAATLLTQMEESLTWVGRERKSLVRSLYVLEISTIQFRMQSSTIDEETREQFIILVRTICQLVADINRVSQERFDALEKTREAGADLLRELHSIAEAQHCRAKTILATSKSRLSALDQELRQSDKDAQSLSQSGIRIGDGVGTVIVAVQFQDIARQKFEHIGAAIDEMVRHIEPGTTRSFSLPESLDCEHYLADASRVQLEQLSSVFDQLDEAADNMSVGLRATAGEANQLAACAAQAASLTAGDSAIAQSLESIQDLQAATGSALEQLRELTSLVDGLQTGFGDCTSELVELAIRLRRVALNSQLLALRIQSGAALEVIAQNTRVVADQAMQGLVSISRRMAELQDAANEVGLRLKDCGEIFGWEYAVLREESACSQHKLRTLQTEAANTLEHLAHLECELSGTVRTAIEQMTFPRTAATARSHARELFEQFAQRDGQGHALSVPTHARIDELKLNYTMAQERELHERAVAQNLSPEAMAATVGEEHGEAHAGAGGSDEDESLAENVELF